ncbi:type II toxin-antitoxin system HicA family toxin [Candidatus Microgenomates bacterium]|nr:type II toxin-antitoxin system HicA family toxin [Candidatus Microgenomates bacterium]
MPKLHSSQKIIKVLRTHGFVFVSQKGSHGKFRKLVGGKTLTAIVPMGKREIPMGTFHSILRQSNLSKENFE